MRIVHIITRSEWGGAQKVVYLLSTSQVARGHEVTVLCGENGRLVENLKKAGIQVILNPHLLRNLSWRDVQAFYLILKEMRSGYDLIHAHSSKAGILARLVGKLTQTPVCFTVHGFGISSKHSYLKQRLYHKIEGYWARFTDALVFVSPGNLEVAREKKWLDHCNQYCVIPNGIDIPSVDQIFKGREFGLREKYKIPENAFVVGNLARVAWMKNPDFWFEVAKQFTMCNPDTYFIWFGAGEINQYQGYERILFVGEVEDIHSALSSMDVLFMTSHSEGMPLAVLEGMARGIPVLLPDLPGLKEVIGIGGEVYPPGEQKHALQILYTLRDVQLRKTLGEQGRNHCCKQYSVERMISGYEELYRRIAKTHD